MKKLLLALVSCVLAIFLLWLLLGRRNPGEASSPSAIESPHAGRSVTTATNARDSQTKKPEVDNDEALEQASEARRKREWRELLAKEEREYGTPITFYGLVLDQHDRPVPTARVVYASVGGSFEGERETFSDAQGKFSITGIHGKRLRIIVSHPGYYDFDQTHSYYVYAGNDQGPDFKPDPARPEIFRLRKKGEAAELVHLASIVRLDPGESQRSFSLFDHSRRRDRPEYVLVRLVDNGRIDSIRRRVPDVELSVPGGGLQPRSDPFQFMAPAGGYQSPMVVQPEALKSIDLFVRFSSGNYGRFTLAGGSSGEFDITSYLNPDGSRNLEYDPAKEITVVPTGKRGIDLLYPPKSDPPPKP